MDPYENIGLNLAACLFKGSIDFLNDSLEVIEPVGDVLYVLILSHTTSLANLMEKYASVSDDETIENVKKFKNDLLSFIGFESVPKININKKKEALN